MRYFKMTGLTVGPFLLGLLFFAASLTPSLIPRDWMMQGILGGVVMALGYLIGRFILGLWRFMDLPEVTGRALVIMRALCVAPVLVLLALSLGHAHQWQNGIRTRMGMDALDSVHTVRTVLLTLAVFAVLVLIAYILLWVFNLVRRKLYRIMPQRTANVAGFILTVLLVTIVTRDGVLDRVITSLDKSVTLAQALFDTAPPAPSDPSITGGPGSLVDWDAMGQPGRDYVTLGPSATDISDFTAREAKQPIRVYVGLAQSETPKQRAKIALAEMIRVDAFEREVLIIALPTGTGWLDPGSMDPVEYMHGGDIATVAVQYSYLQSPLALILETRSGLDQAKALITTIHSYWRDLPKETRPRLYIHGLSLGAWSSMYGTDLFALLDDPINGAFWAGPPFPSTFWTSIVAQRNEDSRYVAPVIGDGRLARFASHHSDAGGPDGWGDMRLVFLQYSSDPIVLYEPTSLFRAPAWMTEPAAVDVSPAMRFIPIVTQFQLAVDLALANTAPSGFGHAYYGPDYIGPWVAVTDPKDWAPNDSARLIAHCSAGFQMGCDHDVTER